MAATPHLAHNNAVVTIISICWLCLRINSVPLAQFFHVLHAIRCLSDLVLSCLSSMYFRHLQNVQNLQTI